MTTHLDLWDVSDGHPVARKELLELQARIAELEHHHKTAVDEWTLEAQTSKQLEDEAHELRASIAALQAERVALKRDAERYRAKRQRDWEDYELRYPTMAWGRKEEWMLSYDAAIAAIVREEEK